MSCLGDWWDCTQIVLFLGPRGEGPICKSSQLHCPGTRVVARIWATAQAQLERGLSRAKKRPAVLVIVSTLGRERGVLSIDMRPRSSIAGVTLMG